MYHARSRTGSPGPHRRLRGLALLLLCAAAPALRAAEAITGCWISEAGTSVIQLEPFGREVRGRVVGLAEPLFIEGEGRGTPGAPRVDLENPDIELRARPLAGLYIVRDLRPDGDRWIDGTIYDPESGNTYSARAELDEDGTLRLRGYLGTPMFGRTTRWTAADAAPAETARMIEALAPWMPDDLPPPDCGVGLPPPEEPRA